LTQAVGNSPPDDCGEDREDQIQGELQLSQTGRFPGVRRSCSERPALVYLELSGFPGALAQPATLPPDRASRHS
jgi:hypothetical protein